MFFLFPRLEHPAGWICAHYKSLLLLLLLVVILMSWNECNLMIENKCSLQEGDKITVLNQVNTEWLYGEVRGAKGNFPSGFVNHVPANLPAFNDSPTEVILIMCQWKWKFFFFSDIFCASCVKWCIRTIMYGISWNRIKSQSTKDVSFRFQHCQWLVTRHSECLIFLQIHSL